MRIKLSEQTTDDAQIQLSTSRAELGSTTSHVNISIFQSASAAQIAAPTELSSVDRNAQAGQWDVPIF